MNIETFSNYFALNQFNFVNTLVYAVMLLVVLYIFYKAVSKLKIKFNLKFFLAALPFVIFGSLLRALVDHEYVFESFWTVTPGIWLLIFLLFLPVYFSCFFLGKKYKFKDWKICMLIGTSLVFILIGSTNIQVRSYYPIFVILGLATFASIVLHILFKMFNQKHLAKKVSFLAFFGHMVDASATFIAVDFFNAVEKHPLTHFFNELAGTAASLFFLKLLVLIPAVYLISTEIKDKNFRNFLLLSLAIIGLAEGLRDAITIMI